MIKRGTKRRIPVPAKRRGVVLLVILSLLTLFVMVGLTYVVVANQYRRSARVFARGGRLRLTPAKTLDRVMYQLLRGTTLRSSLASHSLLGDLYGTDSIRTRVFRPTQQEIADDAGNAAIAQATNTGDARYENSQAAIRGGGQFLEIPIREIDEASRRLREGSNYTSALRNLEDYYNGRVLTFTSGEAKGHSTRILDYYVVPQQYLPQGGSTRFDQAWIVCEAIQSDRGFITPKPDDQVLINGAAFNGTGAGYEKTTGQISPTRALFPHLAGYVAPDFQNKRRGGYDDFGPNQGGYDESWDAVDFQNMALALVPPLPGSDRFQDGDNRDNFNRFTYNRTIPSFHRPALINYLIATGQFNADQRRRAVMRPMPPDHPEFTGSNPYFEDLRRDWANLSPQQRTQRIHRWLRNGPWDVDNNRDGIPDSIWLDAGLPVQTAPGGRRFKPLVAILCQDLDGRINLNAHGNRAQLDSTYKPFSDPYNATGGQTPTQLFQGEISPISYPTGNAGIPHVIYNVGSPFPGHNVNVATWVFYPLIAGTTGTANYVRQAPRGQGYGPAEVFFGNLMSPLNRLSARNEYANLIGQRYGQFDGGNLSQPGAGIGVFDDLGSVADAIGFPVDWNTHHAHWASPPDVWGRGALLLDYFGQPITVNLGIAGSNVNDPYEIDLSETGSIATRGADQPYTLSELEKLLRFNDIDTANLPPRLVNIAPLTFGAETIPNLSLRDSQDIANYQTKRNEARRALVTVDSRHIPVPNVQLPGSRDFRRNSIFNSNALRNVSSFNALDLFYARMLDELRSNPPNTEKVQRTLHTLVAWEIAQGGQLDINRLFGNGLDDDLDRGLTRYGTGNGDTEGSQNITQPQRPGLVTTGVVDNPREVSNGELAWTDNRIGNTPLMNRRFSHRNNDPGNYFGQLNPGSSNSPTGYYPTRELPQQIYARHLYCLLMMLKGKATLNYRQNSSQLENERHTARVLAQFAINVADFRDPDSIMTPFEYDVNPFNGWSVDGNVRSDESSTTSERRVVWGCERPELLITETLAYHDRRVEDLDVGGRVDLSGMDPDRDHSFDQRVRPRSGAFIELFNPWTAANSKPFEFYYDRANNRLNQGVVLNHVNHDGSMVWRMVVIEGKSHENRLDPVDSRRNALPETNPVTTGANSVVFDDRNIERTVYFVNLPNNTNQSPIKLNVEAQQLLRDPRAYSTSLPVNGIAPGRYAVIGSFHQRNGTNSQTGTYDAILTADATGNPVRRVMMAPGRDGPQGIVASGQTTDQPFVFEGTPNQREFDVQRAVGIVINRKGTGTATESRSLSITEPVAGYPVLMQPNDIPFDYGTPFHQDRDARQTRQQLHEFPLRHTQTVYNFRTVKLQRLANPLRAHHATHNPYITVDTASFDVHSYNSLARQSEDPADGRVGDMGEMKDAAHNTPQHELRFRSRQRGGKGGANPPRFIQANPFIPGSAQTYVNSSAPATAPFLDFRNVWRHDAGWTPTGQNAEFFDPLNPSIATDTNDTTKFNQRLVHTLGYLNDRYFPMIDRAVASRTNAPNGMRGAPASRLAGPDGAVGTADDRKFPPFAMLPWHNRPFISPLGIMQVPWTSSAQLFREFRINGDRTNGTHNVYRGWQAGNNGRPGWRFGHLLNFFHSRDRGTLNADGEATNPTQTNDRSLNLHRLFEFINVPSRFVGTKKWFSHHLAEVRHLVGQDGEFGVAGRDDDLDGIVDNFSEAGWPGSDDVVPPQTQNSTEVYTRNPLNFSPAANHFGFQTPHNWISRFRDPGRINLNTLAVYWDWSSSGQQFLTSPVWESLMTGQGLMNRSQVESFALSRQGFVNQRTPSTGSRSDLGTAPEQQFPPFNDNYPTFFANPFRSSLASDLMPRIRNMALVTRAADPSGHGGVQATMLRHASNATGERPLFDLIRKRTNQDPTQDENPASEDIQRNSHFDSLGVKRLANMVSTHSNVYAVWITVGYFQVEQQANTNFPGDGYLLGPELGLDTGRVRRHRAFYIVDRSIPVGFEIGRNHNVDRAIRLRRIIE